MDLRLSVVPFDHVEKSQQLFKETFGEHQDLNTNGHSLEAIKAALPSREHIPPDPVQPWVLLGPCCEIWMNGTDVHSPESAQRKPLTRWTLLTARIARLSLVMKSQYPGVDDRSHSKMSTTGGLDASVPSLDVSGPHVHRIELPRSFLSAMSPISNVAFYKGHLSGDAEDLQFLADTFPKKTVSNVDISQLLQEGRYFARLDTCSLKDSLVGGGPVKDSEDLWKRIATSMRAAAGIQAMAAANSYEPVYLYLLKWNDKMQPGLEYRVFCAPEIMRITAISQYRWFEKWYHTKETWQRQNEIAKRVLENAMVIHQQIMMHPAMNDDLKMRGFVFDILEDPDNDNAACLIELNEFGAMTGCGSCLFHWLDDAKLLYGLEEAVTFRITM
ncbi:MAG: hypothetical protein Q9210_005871 [Variospora velana]